MSLDKDISYIYEKVFTKAHYDKQSSCNVIKLEDYIHLNLTTKQLNILKKMCKNSGIKLETIEYRSPYVEDEIKKREEAKEAEQEIAKFKVDTLKNPNGRGIKIYNFNKETVDVGYTTVNDKIFRKTVKKYTFKDGSWCFYIKKGGRNICVYDWQITMTDEWAAIEFSRFKKYGAR